MTIFPGTDTLPASDSERPRVALCEPDALLGALLAEWLQRAGFEPLPVVAGALPLARVALVVADVPAPRLDGAARIAVLRERFPEASVLAISAQFMAGMNGATAAARALGADAVLAKPFSSASFNEAVRAMCRLQGFARPDAESGA
jgi:DNA-binding response OmpR family regulator